MRRKSTPRDRYISATFPGYIIRTRDGSSRYVATLKAARRLRDKLYGKIPPRWTKHGPQRNSKTGILGVCPLTIRRRRYIYRAIVASYTDYTGNIRRKYFNLRHYSRSEALKLARKWRKNKTGARSRNV